MLLSPTRPLAAPGAVLLHVTRFASFGIEADPEPGNRADHTIAAEHVAGPITRIHRMRLETVQELGRAHHAVVVPRGHRVRHVVVLDDPVVALRIDGRVSRILARVAGTDEGVPAQDARVGALLEVRALRGHILEDVVLDQHPFRVVPLRLTLDRVGALVLRPVRVRRTDVDTLAVLRTVPTRVVHERVPQHPITRTRPEMDRLVTDVEDLHPVDHRAPGTVQHDPLRRMRDGEAFDVPVVAGDREAVVAGRVLGAEHRRPRTPQRDRSHRTSRRRRQQTRLELVLTVRHHDEAIPADAERLFAQRMGATVVELASGHVAMVTHPDEVAAPDPHRCGGRRRLSSTSDRFEPAVSLEALLTFPSSWPRAAHTDPAGQTERLRPSQVMPTRGRLPSHAGGTVATGGVEGMLTAMAAVPESERPAGFGPLPSRKCGQRSRRRLRMHAGRRTRGQARRNPERSTSRSPVACADICACVAHMIPKTSRARCSFASSITSTRFTATRAGSRPGCSRSHATR